jgi:hypothetical protein
MCLPSRSKSPPTPDPEIAVAQEEANDEEQVVRSENKEEALEKKVRRSSGKTSKSGGTGRRSLLTGNSGGMGYYNEYL